MTNNELREAIKKYAQDYFVLLRTPTIESKDIAEKKLDEIMNDLQSELEKREREAYKKGYNDNAKNCYCDSLGALEGVLPHKHLLTNEESSLIRPDINQLQKENEE